MTASSDDILPRIALIAGTIPAPNSDTGYVHGWAFIPNALDENQLPSLVARPGPATVDYRATGREDIVEQTRDYILTLYVAKYELGQEGDAPLLTANILPDFRDAFLSRDKLQVTGQPVLNGIDKAEWISDTGVISLAFSGLMMGAQATLRVTRHVRRNIRSLRS